MKETLDEVLSRICYPSDCLNKHRCVSVEFESISEPDYQQELENNECFYKEMKSCAFAQQSNEGRKCLCPRRAAIAKYFYNEIHGS